MDLSVRTLRVQAAAAATLLTATLLPADAAAQDATLVPFALRCEYLTGPRGIDQAHPRFSWALAPATPELRTLSQSAYQVVVESVRDAANLSPSDPLWDSGKIVSDDTNQVTYAGPPLPSCTALYWKVRVWDADGHASSWSDPAVWSTGPLAPADWGTAEWIGDPTPLPSPDPLDPLPATMLRKAFPVVGEADLVSSATLYATALGLYELRLNGQRIGQNALAP
jgi:alpha-L-rhamnosidase